jgi:hypothetical protein
MADDPPGGAKVLFDVSGSMEDCGFTYPYSHGSGLGRNAELFLFTDKVK